jgi:hypothetical protein
MLHNTINKEDTVVFDKISELKKRIPYWAEKISEQIGKKPGTIRAWSTGDRGMTKGCHILLLEHLTKLDQERSDKIQKLTA